MTTQHTANRIKEVYPKAHGWIIDKLQNLEHFRLIDRGQDLTKEQVRVLGQELGFTVESSTIIADEVEYNDFFNDEIYSLINKMAKAKGLDIDGIDDSTLDELREVIISKLSLFTDGNIDLSPPHREYSLGEKVSLYYDDSPCTATIIQVGTSQQTHFLYEYGLLIDGKYKLAYVEDSDSPTNYMIELQKRINVE